MLSFLFRRSSCAALKGLHWTGPPQRCQPSPLGRFPAGGAVPSCWVSSTRLIHAESDRGRVEPGTVLGFRRPELLRRIQTHGVPFVLSSQCFHSSAVRLKKRAQPEAPPRELDLLRYDLKHLWRAPKPALYLGFAGLIPFLGPPLFMVLTESYYPELAYAQLAYGASIVSFLGGARWGFALPESSPARPDWINLANSVVPSLLAWVSVLMSDNITPAAFMVIIGLGISLHYDLALLPTYPSWFKAQRAVLTVVAFFSLVGTLILNGFYPDKKLLKD